MKAKLTIMFLISLISLPVWGQQVIGLQMLEEMTNLALSGPKEAQPVWKEVASSSDGTVNVFVDMSSVRRLSKDYAVGVTTPEPADDEGTIQVVDCRSHISSMSNVLWEGQWIPQGKPPTYEAAPEAGTIGEAIADYLCQNTKE